MDIQQRLALFYERLRTAPPARNAEAAFALICRTLEAVEAEHCPVAPQHPPPRSFDGRMYSPQMDNVRIRDDGSWWVKTRRHRIAIEQNGSFVIYRQWPGKQLVKEMEKKGSRP